MNKKQYSGPSKKTGNYGYKSENSRNRNGKMSMEDKKQRSAIVGLILAFIQLFLSVAFVALLYNKHFLFITIPIWAGIIAFFIILFGIVLFMQQKSIAIMTFGKCLSVFTIILVLLASYIVYPINPMPRHGAQLSADEPFVVFVSASDTFGSLDDDTNSRSDTNILAVVNPKTHTVLMVSTPRDYYVPIQAEGVAPASYDKLTHVGLYGNGIATDDEGNEVGISDWTWAYEVDWQPGNEALMDTLQNLYSFEISENNYHYVELNFTGFADLIDALGGIEVYVDVPFSTTTYETYGDTDNGKRKTYVYKEGNMEMDGDTALTFARERKSFASGDIQRSKNQVKVIKAMAQKILSPAILTNYHNIVNSIENSFTTNINISSVVNLVSGTSTSDWNIMSYSVSGDSSREICTWDGSSLSVVLQDPEQVTNASTLIKMVLDGSTAQEVEKKINKFQK